MDYNQCRWCYLPKQQHSSEPRTGSWSFCALEIPEYYNEKAPGATNTQGQENEFCKCFEFEDKKAELDC